VKQKIKEHRISKPLAPPLPQPFIIEYNRGAHAPLCFDSKELPDFEAMKDRMIAIAMENGLLGGVHDDCIELMLHALEVSRRILTDVVGMADKTVFDFVASISVIGKHMARPT